VVEDRHRDFLKTAENRPYDHAAESPICRTPLGLHRALSLVIGAFIARVPAALGGRQRDLHP
jgi:hypothetical protein